MTVSQLDQLPGFIRLGGPDEDREIRKIYCCDLLSLAMARAPADCAWVTVMGNMNTVAVATLADAACIVLAENAAIPEECIRKAADEEVAVYRCDEPIFETAKRIDALL